MSSESDFSLDPADHPDLLLLPDGNWVERFLQPCPTCCSVIFTIARVRYSIDGGSRERVESFCPICLVLGHAKKGTQKQVIGHHDLQRGTITLF